MTGKRIGAAICGVCDGAILAPQSLDLHAEKEHPDEDKFGRVLSEAIDGEDWWDSLGFHRRDDYRKGAAAIWRDIVRAVAAKQAGESGEPRTTVAWLIERGQSMRQVPTVWWTGNDWTEDAWKALRFGYRVQAEAYIDSHIGLAIPSHGDRFGIAVEHGFGESGEPKTHSDADEFCRCADCLSTMAEDPTDD